MEVWQVGILVMTAGCSLVALAFSFLAWRGQARLAVPGDHGTVLARVTSLDEGQGRLERSVRDDLRSAREEGQSSGRHLREEVQASVKVLVEAVVAQMGEMGRLQREGLDQFAVQLRQGASDQAQRLREHQDALVGSVREIREQMGRHLETMKTDAAETARTLREHVGTSLGGFGETTRAQTDQLFSIQKSQHEDFTVRLKALGEASLQAGTALREGVEAQLSTLRNENTEKLEQMRATVDEKLQGTLEQRIGESFRLVSERLEAVHKGLGEMQVLATGVGDLKRVLTNVKARGSWGEVQLGALLGQILTQDQYVANVATAEASDERVEYAIRLPHGVDGQDLLLPIDAKFPMEDYERLQAAADTGDLGAVEAASRALELRIRGCAKDICSKYVHPPRTTDFAILFLPTEGLYAEVIRRPGLVDALQHDCRIVVAGPTVLMALLNSLQMGFRTLAIQKRSSEVWQVLGAVKTEFGKFGPVLEKVRKKLHEASSHMDSVGVRERAIQRKLRQVEALPAIEVESVLEVVETGPPDEDEPEVARIGVAAE